MQCLPPGAYLPPLNLTERGRLVRIAVTGFAAGRLRTAVAERMAAAAEHAVREARVHRETAMLGCDGGCQLCLRGERARRRRRARARGLPAGVADMAVRHVKVHGVAMAERAAQRAGVWTGGGCAASRVR